MSSDGPTDRSAIQPRILVVCATLIVGAACATARTPAASPDRVVSVSLPQIAPLPQTAETQTKGGVSMTLAPTRFETTSTERCSYGLPTGILLLGAPPAGVPRNSVQPMTETRYRGPRITPDDLTFLLTVRNQMERVFRGAGAVVQFNVDGRVQAVEQANYVDVINAMIPPRGESQIRFRGPTLSSLGKEATLGVFLYDVVTDTDAAGNVSKRENFEWYFQVGYETVSDTAQVLNHNVWVPNQFMTAIAERTPDGGIRIIDRKEEICLEGVLPR